MKSLSLSFPLFFQSMLCDLFFPRRRRPAVFTTVNWQIDCRYGSTIPALRPSTFRLCLCQLAQCQKCYNTSAIKTTKRSNDVTDSQTCLSDCLWNQSKLVGWLSNHHTANVNVNDSEKVVPATAAATEKSVANSVILKKNKKVVKIIFTSCYLSKVEHTRIFIIN